MKHLTEEELIAYRYSEAPKPAAIQEHLEQCQTCRANFDVLERVLAAVDAAPLPHRDESYGHSVWQHIRARLDSERLRHSAWQTWLVPRRWAVAAATAVLVLAAFLAGRFWPRPEKPVLPVAVEPIPEQARERILLVAVGDHLDRAQMILVELVNASGAAPAAKAGTAQDLVDISDEQRRAQELVAANRLYRQTAAQAGDQAMAAVLDELERVLLEVAHSPAQLSSVEWSQIRQRIEAKGILFKVRVVGSDVREREKSTTETAPNRSQS